MFCPPGSQGLLHFQHHTRPVPEIGREEDRSQCLLNWGAAAAGLVRVGKPSPLWTEPPFVSFDPKTETPGHRMAGVCALIPSDGHVQARLVPSSKPSTAPANTPDCGLSLPSISLGCLGILFFFFVSIICITLNAQGYSFRLERAKNK